MGAGHAGEAGSGSDAAAVVDERTDVHRRVTREIQRGDPVEEVVEQHVRRAFHHGEPATLPGVVVDPVTRSTASACCMMRENTGAAAVLAKNPLAGSVHA